AASRTTIIAASSQQAPVHVTAVNLLVAHGAVLEARRAQVMEGGRHYTRGRSGTDRRRQVGVTLQTHLLYYRARQHPRIGGPVRLVARVAAFKTHGRVLERERSALVPMAPEAARLIG